MLTSVHQYHIEHKCFCVPPGFSKNGEISNNPLRPDEEEAHFTCSRTKTVEIDVCRIPLVVDDLKIRDWTIEMSIFKGGFRYVEAKWFSMNSVLN